MLKSSNLTSKHTEMREEKSHMVALSIEKGITNKVTNDNARQPSLANDKLLFEISTKLRGTRSNETQSNLCQSSSPIAKINEKELLCL